MADILTPALGESVTEATIGKWTKKAGDAVKKDEVLVELETDKVSLEVVSPADGVLSEIQTAGGRDRDPGTVLGEVDRRRRPARPAAPRRSRSPPPAAARMPDQGEAPPKPAAAPREDELLVEIETDKPLSPAVRRIAERKRPRHLARSPARGKRRPRSPSGAAAAPPCRRRRPEPRGLAATGPKGITKADARPRRAAAPRRRAGPASSRPRARRRARSGCKMTRLRQTIARRLKESQNTAAQLTTFNEVDMTDGHGPARASTRRSSRSATA